MSREISADRLLAFTRRLLTDLSRAIYLLGGLPIRSVQDVLYHFGQTDVAFINIRIGRAERCVLVLPAS
jgi:hypothetical protein